MCLQQVKDYENYAKFVCTSEKTVKIMLNGYVVGKKL